MINCAGLYADRIAKDFGLAQDYMMLPFKGVYLVGKNANNPTEQMKTHIYKVPALSTPFLGVHFTLAINQDGSQNKIKIGPTAIPAFWRENYKHLTNIKFNEIKEIMALHSKMFVLNKVGYRNLVFQELKKYSKQFLINEASKLVHNIDNYHFKHWGVSGIRAQIVNTKSYDLIQDFIIEQGDNSIHMLNAISPGLTCSMALAEHIISKVVEVSLE